MYVIYIIEEDFNMSLAVIAIPEGCTPEQKKRLLAGVKQACAEGFELKPTQCFAYITEILRENIGEGAEVIKWMTVYTTYGKTILGKNLISKRFDEVCKEVFNEPDCFNIVMFKEHVGENVGVRGGIRTLKSLFEK